MSIADHFERAPDAGFIRDYDANAARRQFNMSMVLILVVAAAATALGVVVRFEAPASAVGQLAGGQVAGGQVAAPPAYVGKL